MKKELIEAIKEARAEFKVLDVNAGKTAEYISRERIIKIIEKTMDVRYGLAVPK